MRSIGWVMARDCWVRGRGYFLLALLSSLILPCLVSGGIGDRGMADPRLAFYLLLWIEPLTSIAYIGFTQSEGLVSGAVRKGRVGFPSRLFILPATTARLVGWQLVIGMGFMALVHLVAMGVLGYRWRMAPPLAEPIFYLLTMYTCFMAILWGLPDFAYLRLLAAVMVVAPLGLWLQTRFSFTRMSSSEVVWPASAPWNCLWMGALILVAWAVATAGVARDRRGDAQGIPSLQTLWRVVLNRLPWRRRGFASPAAAQFWFEWRQRGWFIPIAMGLFLVAILLLFAFTGNREVLLFGLVPWSIFGAPFCAFVVGGQLGQAGNLGRGNTLDLYRATRPLADRALAGAMLKVGGAGILISWLFGLAVLGATMSIFKLSGDQVAHRVLRHFFLSVADGPIQGFWTVALLAAAALLLAWIILSLMLALGMTGHMWVMGPVLWAPMALFLCFALVKPMLTPQALLLIANGILVTLGTLMLVGTAVALGSAYWKRLSGKASFAAGLAGWAFAVLAGVAAVRLIRPDASGPMVIFVLGVLTLAPSTPVLGALALHWNRHR